MAGEKGFTLFGMPTPEEIRARIGRTGREEDLSIAASLAPGRGIVFNALQAGRGLGNLIGSALGENTEEAALINKMNTMQGIFSQAAEASQGDELAYMQNVAQGLMDAGMYNEASQAIERVSELQKIRSETSKNLADAGRKSAEVEKWAIELGLDQKKMQVLDRKTNAQIKHLESLSRYYDRLGEKAVNGDNDALNARRRLELRMISNIESSIVDSYNSFSPNKIDSIDELPVEERNKWATYILDKMYKADAINSLMMNRLSGQILGSPQPSQAPSLPRPPEDNDVDFDFSRG